MIDKSRCYDAFIWNPSICECECDKACNIGQYLDYKNCNYREELIDKLVVECSEDIISGNEMIHNVTLIDYRKVCKSYTIDSIINHNIHNNYRY